MNRAYRTIQFSQRDHVATLTFDNPGKRNALDLQMRDEIAEIVGLIGESQDIRAAILIGAGGHFCSGGDVRNIAASQLGNAGWRVRMQNVHRWLQELLTLDKPVIAAVDGAAVGAGFSLALAADFILATPRARFAMSFLRVGLVPDCGAFYTLPRFVGMQRAKELMLSTRELSAPEAQALGIVMEIHDADVLLQRAQVLAESFVNASPTAVSLIKRTLNVAGNADLAALLEIEASTQALAAGTDEHRGAVDAFLNKKPFPFQWPQG
ncbi:enoyl-CoA hydratase/isomerase family protein [Cupriavidus lacunae]|uniref:Enoyl-CoA hydratase/isomerase family protein n=1 Tax=Cupriavidus lacunae TaxID=2666307 RepID=A0A370NJS5_9BURK|nr:enoyl-CoA hydratase/isomerase family protein [Cupriavidus lacunae]RDK05851.1 enoyl-CoA hydratase/isomerase family protein [Cupriavidus lacunae]